jgi:hypothetical protein
MKKSVAIILLMSLAVMTLKAQNMKELNDRISALEDRVALKNLVDTFSILADIKDTESQKLLFTEDAVVESRVQGQAGMTLRGRQQIGNAFAAYLSTFETVYHLNGQQSVSLSGDKASGISYCYVTLIGNENGKMIKTTMYVRYNDEFVRERNRWLISKRTSDFRWQNREELNQ